MYNNKDLFATERQLYEAVRTECAMTITSFAFFYVLDKKL